jgi:hypothetical protein
MAVAHALGDDLAARVAKTVALVGARGYALSPARLAAVCVGGAINPGAVLAAVSSSPGLQLEEGLVVSSTGERPPASIAVRSSAHDRAAAGYLPVAIAFVRRFVVLNPYVLSVSIAGSLASGGFRVSDDIDLNLVVEDGRRHLAYFTLNALAYAHAVRHRGKAVDGHTRRPLAPRLVTANLVLERSQCFPLVRQDEQMAYELLVSEPVHGGDFMREVIASNPGLLAWFPQLATRVERLAQPDPPRRLPRALFPGWLDVPARAAGRAAWRWMQWTRRRDRIALEHVAFVRRTMRPYVLFDT